MKKEVFDIVKKEAVYLGIVFLLALIIFKIAFYKESSTIVFRTVLSLLWLFALPGYCIMLYWGDRLEFIERLVIGIFVSAATTGVFSYYIGLMGFNVKYHAVLLPVLIIIAGLLLAMKGKNNSN